MRLSTQADYAVRCVYELALHPAGAVLHTREIAKAQNVREGYLAKVVQALARAGLLRTVRGSKGGVVLARPSNRITVREVWEAVDGPLEFHRCALHGEPCGPQKCGTHDFCERVESMLRGELERASFACLVEESTGRSVPAEPSVGR